MFHKYDRTKAENASDLAVSQQKYDEHMSLKEKSRKAKELNKVRANEDNSFNSLRKYQKISIFSDTYGSQNRNQFRICLMLYVVQVTHLEVIEHKYLESGHTHMEVDSMHSAFENQMPLMPIFSMIDLYNVLKIS